MAASNIYVAWISFQRRQESFKPFFSLDCYYFPVSRSSLFAKIFSYIVNFYKTFFLIRNLEPKVVFVQVPQTPALLAAFLARFIFRIDCLVIADCHNAMFRRPWLDYPGTKRLLFASDYVLVHNFDIYRKAISLLGRKEKIFNVPDAPSSFSVPDVDGFLNSKFRFGSGFCFVFPASWAKDEPIRDLVLAFSELNDARLIVTGRPKPEVLKGVLCPDNVSLVGYLDNYEFDYLINRCDCVFALTAHDDVQLSVCGEAIGAERPLICSDTSLLRAMYGDCAVFTENSAKAFVDAVKFVVNDYGGISSRMRLKKARAFSDWSESNSDFIKIIKGERL